MRARVNFDARRDTRGRAFLTAASARTGVRGLARTIAERRLPRLWRPPQRRPDPRPEGLHPIRQRRSRSDVQRPERRREFFPRPDGSLLAPTAISRMPCVSLVAATYTAGHGI